MADEKSSTSSKQVKKKQTVRQRASKITSKNPRRLKRAGTNAGKPIKAVAAIGRKEFYLPLPDNKTGRFLNKKRKFIPGYFRGAWNEVKQVKWPKGKETAKLTFAVFMFAIFFMALITIVDFGLDKVFKQLILK